MAKQNKEVEEVQTEPTKEHRIVGINPTMRTATIVAEGYQDGEEIAIPFQGNEDFKLKTTKETEYHVSY